MRRFTQLYRDLDESGDAAGRAAALARYFREAPAGDAAWALWLLWGNRLRLGISARRLRQWAAGLSGCPDWLVEACQQQVGDVAETAALLLPLPATPAPAGSLRELVEDRLLPLRHWDQAFQLQLLRDFWLSLGRDEALVVNKLLCGSLGLGVSRALLVRALADALGRDPAWLAWRLCGEWQPTAAWYGGLCRPGEAPGPPPVEVPPPALAALLEDLADDPAAGDPAAAPCSARLVLAYAQAGGGRAGGLFSLYTLAARDGERLLPVARIDAQDHLTQPELRQIDQWIRDHTLARRGPVRTVPPELVFTIGFAGIRPSARHKAGLLLRHPRILEWRMAAEMEDISSLNQLRQLAD